MSWDWFIIIPIMSGPNEDRRKMIWVGRKRMSLPKHEGGLDFCEIEKFNYALLAKQVEESYKHSTVWWCKFSKVDTFPTLTYTKITWNQTILWLAIYIFRPRLVNQRSSIQIGNDASTRPDIGYWMPSHPPRHATNHPLRFGSLLKDLWKFMCN